MAFDLSSDGNEQSTFTFLGDQVFALSLSEKEESSRGQRISKCLDFKAADEEAVDLHEERAREARLRLLLLAGF